MAFNSGSSPPHLCIFQLPSTASLMHKLLPKENANNLLPGLYYLSGAPVNPLHLRRWCFQQARAAAFNHNERWKLLLWVSLHLTTLGHSTASLVGLLLVALPAPLVIGCPWAPVKALGAGGKDKLWTSGLVPQEEQLILPMGWWKGSNFNFVAFFVGLERETQGILSFHAVGPSCIQQGML